MPTSPRATGALLLCRAEPPAARPAAHLTRQRLLLAPAGGWSVLVPETEPWRGGEEALSDVLAGWASALAIGATWPVLSLWWEDGRTGFALSSGFRRPVVYGWEAAGRAEGEPDAMRILAARLGLDPVLDLAELELLTRPDASADGETRLLGLIALLGRAGLALPAGLSPGEPAQRLRKAARTAPGAEVVEGAGWRDAVRAELDVVEEGPLGPWMRGPKARLLGAAQIAAGAPLMVWAARRRSPRWLTAGAVLVTRGVLALAYDRARTPR